MSAAAAIAELRAALVIFDDAAFAAALASAAAAVDAARATAPAEALLRDAELAVLESRWAMMHRRDPTPRAVAGLELAEEAARRGAPGATALGLAALAHSCLCAAPRSLGRLVHGQRLRRCAEEALELEAGEPFASFALGLYWLKLPATAGGSPARAARHLEDAVRGLPQDAACRAVLVEAYHRAGDRAAAARELDVLRQTSPRLVATYLTPLFGEVAR